MGQRMDGSEIRGDRVTHKHSASPPQSDPWCPICDTLLTWAIIIAEVDTNLHGQEGNDEYAR